MNSDQKVKFPNTMTESLGHRANRIKNHNPNYQQQRPAIS